MTEHKGSLEKLLDSLQERAKELNCLYDLEELLNNKDIEPEELFRGVIDILPPGWQYPDVCIARIVYEDQYYQPNDFRETPWVLKADIVAQERVVGTIEVYYTREMPTEDDGPFLKEETRLIRTIADRLGHYLLHHQLKQVFEEWDSARKEMSVRPRAEWRSVLHILRRTDRSLYLKISHTMLNHLCWRGVKEAEDLLKNPKLSQSIVDGNPADDSNRPGPIQPFQLPIDLAPTIFRIAADNLTDDEMVASIQRWIQEDKASFLVQVVNRNLPLSEVADAVRRYYHLTQGEMDFDSPAMKGVKVSLIRRLLADHLNYINVAKKYMSISELYHLMQRIIFSADSHGKLGGKSAGVFLAAQVLKNSHEVSEQLGSVKQPNTWYISSDMLLQFMHFNSLDGIVEQKYKPIDQVRFEYPHIVHSFKSSVFPPEMVNGLSTALDDVGEKPLIVRSSSLLEDRMGAAFSGKYKSLFLANQGSKQQRLEALLDAIAEVYASTFGPDPIEYRAERSLIDFGEEMGILIQEVVGARVGDYYLPTFAGVAFSRNEFRWSPRIKREDGLVRLVPGLGTRAVDRLSDDYPVLMAPGQPNLRVNQSTEDILRYSPHFVDVIDLKRNTFKTMPFSELLKEFGYQIPGINKLVSIHKEGHLRRPMGLNINFDEDDLVCTFDGLMNDQQFIKQMQAMLSHLERELGTPVDIEFAHDGRDLYLLQCRPQSHAEEALAAPIPKDIPEEKIVFSAKRFVSNGRVQEITHIVYVDPDAYAGLATREDLLAVGRVVSRLNKLLPKRQFILMGPGRWGSRGDIKLGVNVTYSDINNTAILIEVARKTGNYTPDLSFGTHFFQDLVEARIRYLPLYPDDEGIIFNERFLKGSRNLLSEMLPEFTSLEHVVRLIDVKAETDGRVVHVLMNADLDEAVAIITKAGTLLEPETRRQVEDPSHSESSWRWRMGMAEEIARQIDRETFGVKAMYLLGSTKNATAGAGSDIDLLIHVDSDGDKRGRLLCWLEGWSMALDEMNYLRTGYRAGGLLDVHLVTDDDIANKTSWAAKIDAVTDAARPLMLGRAARKPLE